MKAKVTTIHTCVHGTVHTDQEYFAAAGWAIRTFPLKSLEAGECWIQLWRERA